MTFGVLFWKSLPWEKYLWQALHLLLLSSLTKTRVWSLDSVSNLRPCVVFFFFLLLSLPKRRKWEEDFESTELLTGIRKMDPPQPPRRYNEWWVLIKKAFGQTEVKQYCCGERSDRDGFIFVFLLCQKDEKGTRQFLLVYVFGASRVGTRADYCVLSERRCYLTAVNV